MQQMEIISLHTLPVPKQFEHLCVVGARKGRSKSPDIEIGSVFKQTPLAEHRAQAKYPAHGADRSQIIDYIRRASNASAINRMKAEGPKTQNITQ